jgi:hypothetical protein
LKTADESDQWIRPKSASFLYSKAFRRLGLSAPDRGNSGPRDRSSFMDPKKSPNLVNVLYLVTKLGTKFRSFDANDTSHFSNFGEKAHGSEVGIRELRPKHGKLTTPIRSKEKSLLRAMELFRFYEFSWRFPLCFTFHIVNASDI